MRFSDGVPNRRQPWLRPVAAELGVEEAHRAGLEYIHATGSMATHGNIKSSNILLSRTVDARVTEHGLAHLVGPTGVLTARVAGYRRTARPKLWRTRAGCRRRPTCTASTCCSWSC